MPTPNPKPTQHAQWASDPTAEITEPSPAKKASGWVNGETPPAGFFNWLSFTIYGWCLYLDTLFDNAITWTAAHTFNAAVTTGPAAPVTINKTLHVVDVATFDKDGAGWVDLPLNTAQGWASAEGSGYNRPSYRVDAFGRVWLRGCAVIGTNSKVATLPSTIVPTGPQGVLFVAYQEGSTRTAAFLQVAGTGASGLANPGDILIYQRDTTSGATLHFDGLCYYPDGE